MFCMLNSENVDTKYACVRYKYKPNKELFKVFMYMTKGTIYYKGRSTVGSRVDRE